MYCEEIQWWTQRSWKILAGCKGVGRGCPPAERMWQCSRQGRLLGNRLSCTPRSPYGPLQLSAPSKAIPGPSLQEPVLPALPAALMSQPKADMAGQASTPATALEELTPAAAAAAPTLLGMPPDMLARIAAPCSPCNRLHLGACCCQLRACSLAPGSGWWDKISADRSIWRGDGEGVEGFSRWLAARRPGVRQLWIQREGGLRLPPTLPTPHREWKPLPGTQGRLLALGGQRGAGRAHSPPGLSTPLPMSGCPHCAVPCGPCAPSPHG